MEKDPNKLRSHRYFGPDDLRSFGHRSRMKQLGMATEDFFGKPFIGILNTWNDLNTCHAHLRERAEDVKRGVWQAGGFPVEIPVMSLSETFMKPTAMYYRNLLAMETEEAIRCHPLDAVVLMGGCDKTTPALLMGAASVNVPAIFLPSGPMAKGCWRGNTLGSGSDVWKYWAERNAGNLGCDAWNEIEDGIARSPGHCMTMGTASTMACVAEALGMTLPGAAAIPAVLAEHRRLASNSGRTTVDLAWNETRPRDIMTAAAFDNAITADMAIGGSTNAIVHILALAGRCGLKLKLDDFDAISRKTPFIANLRPSGEYLMEDFYEAGGVPALLTEIQDLLDQSCLTVNGNTLGENIEGAEAINKEVIRPRSNPIASSGSTKILKGNLAPDGAVIKPTAAEPRLLKHRGPAVVFKDYPDLKARLDDPSLGITADHVLILQTAGPLGGPGIPEWGMLPIPKHLLEQGVRDMVRISDSRMSGTSYGTCILHVAPESFAGGPFALVRDGDMIELDVEERRLHLDVSDEELEKRRADWTPPKQKFSRGYGKLYFDETTQANEGCDFRFLHYDGSDPGEPDIY